MTKVLWIALAGALGTVSRYAVDSGVQRLHGGPFPWGTFVANVAGCFLFGAIWALTEGKTGLSTETRTIILTGFMGAFTTFSTFVFHTQQFIAEARWLYATGHFAVHNVAGIAALFAGLAVGKAA
jgi:CrcB protein